MNEHQYYNIGNTFENFCVSNSSLSKINPSEGGHPKEFKAFFDKNKEKKQSLSMETGSVIHKYIENPDEFKVLDFEKPSSARMMYLLENIYKDHLNEISYSDKTIEFHVNNVVEALRIEEGKGIPTKLQNLGTEAGYKRPPKDLDENERKYLQYLALRSTSTVLTGAQKQSLENAKSAIEDNRFLKQKLMDGYVGYVKLKEVDIYFQTPSFICKGLIDDLNINFNEKSIIIRDVKTTGKPISNFIPNKDTGYIGDFHSRRIYRQLAFYRRLVQSLFAKGYTMNFEYKPTLDKLRGQNIKEWKIYCEIDLIKITPEPHATIIPVSEYWLNKGLEEAKELLGRIAWHKKENVWNLSKEEHMNGGTTPMIDPLEYMYK